MCTCMYACVQIHAVLCVHVCMHDLHECVCRILNSHQIGLWIDQDAAPRAVAGVLTSDSDGHDGRGLLLLAAHSHTHKLSTMFSSHSV